MWDQCLQAVRPKTRCDYLIRSTVIWSVTRREKLPLRELPDADGAFVVGITWQDIADFQCHASVESQQPSCDPGCLKMVVAIQAMPIGDNPMTVPFAMKKICA